MGRELAAGTAQAGCWPPAATLGRDPAVPLLNCQHQQTGHRGALQGPRLQRGWEATAGLR